MDLKSQRALHHPVTIDQLLYSLCCPLPWETEAQRGRGVSSCVEEVVEPGLSPGRTSGFVHVVPQALHGARHTVATGLASTFLHRMEVISFLAPVLILHLSLESKP